VNLLANRTFGFSGRMGLVLRCTPWFGKIIFDQRLSSNLKLVYEEMPHIPYKSNKTQPSQYAFDQVRNDSPKAPDIWA
jgi:hypothetical protein